MVEVQVVDGVGEPVGNLGHLVVLHFHRRVRWMEGGRLVVPVGPVELVGLVELIPVEPVELEELGELEELVELVELVVLAKLVPVELVELVVALGVAVRLERRQLILVVVLRGFLERQTLFLCFLAYLSCSSE